jgi:hypothetical protein
MIKNVLTHIGGIEVYGIISICLFFAVFIGALLWAALVRKSFADRMSALPLDDGSRNSTQEGDSHHE